MFANPLALTGGQVGDLTAQQAQTVAAVYAAIHAYSDTISTLDLALVDRATDDADAAHPLAAILAGDFNREQTAQQALAYLVSSLFTRGNAYAQIVRTAGGKPLELVPLDPDTVTPKRKNGKIIYQVSTGSGEEAQEPDELPADDVIHVAINWQPKVLRGVSPIAYARSSIALGLALDAFGLAFFTNGAQTRVLLEAPGAVTEDQARQIVERFNANNSGLENAHRTGLLSGGVKAHTLTVAPDEAQFLETRKFTVNEIARWFGLPPSRIGGDRSSGTYSNLLQDQQAFITHSIRPVCKMFAAELERKLLLASERAAYRIAFDLDDLTEGLAPAPAAPAQAADDPDDTATDPSQEAPNGE
jgi:HK97 family phage portal protein